MRKPLMDEDITFQSYQYSYRPKQLLVASMSTQRGCQ